MLLFTQCSAAITALSSTSWATTVAGFSWWVWCWCGLANPTLDPYPPHPHSKTCELPYAQGSAVDMHYWCWLEQMGHGVRLGVHRDVNLMLGYMTQDVCVFVSSCFCSCWWCQGTSCAQASGMTHCTCCCCSSHHWCISRWCCQQRMCLVVARQHCLCGMFWGWDFHTARV